MMPDHFMLDSDRNVVRATDMAEYTRWFKDPKNRLVGYDEIGDAAVSTVFLGLDQNRSGKGAPLLFETRVFGGPLDGEQALHATWTEAEASHREMAARVRKAGGA